VDLSPLNLISFSQQGTAESAEEEVPEPVYFVPVSFVQELLGKVTGFHPELLSIIEERSGSSENPKAGQEISKESADKKSNAEAGSDGNNVVTVLADALYMDELFDCEELQRSLDEGALRGGLNKDWKIDDGKIRTALQQLRDSKKTTTQTTAAPQPSTLVRYIPILNCSERKIPENSPSLTNINNQVAETMSYRVVTVTRWRSAAVDLSKLSVWELGFFGEKFCDLFCFKSGLMAREQEGFFHSKEFRASVDVVGKLTDSNSRSVLAKSRICPRLTFRTAGEIKSRN
jgi:hypothetical protein